jgi:hypothetical protein
LGKLLPRLGLIPVHGCIGGLDAEFAAPCANADKTELIRAVGKATVGAHDVLAHFDHSSRADFNHVIVETHLSSTGEEDVNLLNLSMIMPVGVFLAWNEALTVDVLVNNP